MKKEIEIPELTRVSSKGQIVIPLKIRKKMGIKEGSVLAVSAKKNLLVLKKLDKKLTEEDLRTLKSIEEAWKEIEEGKFKRFAVKEFFKELDRMKKSLKK